MVCSASWFRLPIIEISLRTWHKIFLQQQQCACFPFSLNFSHPSNAFSGRCKRWRVIVLSRESGQCTWNEYDRSEWLTKERNIELNTCEGPRSCFSASEVPPRKVYAPSTARLCLVSGQRSEMFISKISILYKAIVQQYTWWEISSRARLCDIFPLLKRNQALEIAKTK